jgi:hypothetical protein
MRMTPKKQFIIFLAFVVGFMLILMLTFGRRSGTNNSGDSKKENKVFELRDYDKKDAEIVATFDGPINGDDEHRSVRVTVTRQARTLEVIQGYQGKVIKTQSYPNNEDAYYDFVHALARTNFGKKRHTNAESEVGACATGRRFVYEVLDENRDSVSRTWAGSCMKGTSFADTDPVNNLFRRQITDYGKLVSGVNY